MTSKLLDRKEKEKMEVCKTMTAFINSKLILLYSDIIIGVGVGEGA